MKHLFDQVLSHPTVREKPPVLVDIGASGRILEQWKPIAKHSICVAFDADTRDFDISESTDKGYKKLYLFNRLVAAQPTGASDFYLTRSPHCSSSLRPDSEALTPWSFCHAFDIEQIIKMPAVNLDSALIGIGLDRIDWFKTDSQGTDLRIFDALPKHVIENILVAEFEPGIIDAYCGEDKLHHILAYMDKKPFWVTQMLIKGAHRIDQEDLSRLSTLQRRFLGSFLKSSPGWCEISYINSYVGIDLKLREYLIGWVFASIKGEHGFASHIARQGRSRFQEPLFNDMQLASLKALKGNKAYFNIGLRGLQKVARLVRGVLA